MQTIMAFTEIREASFLQLWNREFKSKPNFHPLTPSLFKKRWLQKKSPFGEFHAETFLLSLNTQDEICGFVHGDLFPAEIAQQALKEPAPIKIGYIGCFLVAARHRRQGIGTRLFETLSEKLYDLGAAKILLDTRCLNPFYGNIEAPMPILWGTPEGIGIQENDQETVAFLDAHGFLPAKQALSLQKTCSYKKGQDQEKDQTPLPEDGLKPQGGLRPQGYELVNIGRKIPILGKKVAELPDFATDHPVTTLAWVKNPEPHAKAAQSQDSPTVLGYGTIFPLGNPNDTHYGLYELNLHDSLRGKGLGKKLVQALLGQIQDLKGESLETVVVPGNSPQALALYQGLGFRESTRWILF